MKSYEKNSNSLEFNDNIDDNSSSTTSSSQTKMFQITSPTTTMKTTSNSLISSLTILLVMFYGCSMLFVMVQAQPIAAMEFHRPYDHRSAMNTLKELDKYYSQMARPRFGKRSESSSSNNNLPIMLTNSNDLDSLTNAVDQIQNNNNNDNSNGNGGIGSSIGGGAIFSNGPYRWLLINREQPLTKLTQNYLMEILAENLERKRPTGTGNLDSGNKQQQEKRHQE